jgi:hypothetical protein
MVVVKNCLGIAALLALAGCSSGGGGNDPVSDPIWIAVGADVTLQITILDPVPASLTDVTINSADFTLGTAQLGFQQIQVPVHAAKPGDAKMLIHFRDDHGAAWKKTVYLHAADVTRTTLDVQCNSAIDNRTLYAFSPGAAFTFIAQAFAGDMPLLSGTLELVQAGGAFTLAPPTGQDREQRLAMAPVQTGSYAWQLAGSGSATFVVYEAGLLSLTLTGDKDPVSRITSLTLRRDVAGAPVCVHDHDDRITITVTAGACRPAMSGAEVAGPMPVNARDGDPSFQLIGSGSCTVEARVDGGGMTTGTYDVEPEMFQPTQTSGTALSPAGVQIGTDPPAGTPCAQSPTDGDCDGKPDPAPVSDPTCVMNSDWYVGLFDGTQNPSNGLAPADLVGVGLTTELRLGIVAYGLIAVGPPQNLRMVNTPAGSLQITDLACNTGDQRLALVAQAPGQPALELHADNLGDVGAFTMQARAIARTVFDTTDHDSDVPAPDPIVDFFVRSHLWLGLHYEDSSGSRLRGYAPVVITSDGTGTGAFVTMEPFALYAGDVPHTVTVASPRIGASQTIHVDDATAIAGIGGDFADTSLAAGEIRCVQMFPTQSAGRRIFGAAPSRPVLTFTGSAMVMGPSSSCNLGVALEGFAAGTSGLAFAWGTGSATHTWTVTGP